MKARNFLVSHLLAELLVLLLELQYLVVLVRDGVAASGERVLAVGLIFRRLPSEGAARHVELVGQPLDRDLSLENQSRGGELELPVVAFSWHSLNTFLIETLDSPCPFNCPSPTRSLTICRTRCDLPANKTRS